jgi:hypothetical protein
MAAPAIAEHDQRPCHHQEVGNEKRDRGVAGKLEPFIAGRLSDQNSDDSHEDTEIPKGGAADEKKRMPERGSA